MENVGGEILRLIAIADPSGDERVDALEIVFVKAGRSTLGRVVRPRSNGAQWYRRLIYPRQ